MRLRKGSSSGRRAAAGRGGAAREARLQPIDVERVRPADADNDRALADAAPIGVVRDGEHDVAALDRAIGAGGGVGGAIELGDDATIQRGRAGCPTAS
ncbi:MAG: hypothetical protein A2138_15345 [Deltaproteobacteria bacterium RBG_16_71_12]|nr:MAG: hypothetical protein A2138_15345 [Deltaproteobacteria bacterium RBG_16_71_12]